MIQSTEGVRQGDVLGPLLFCIALKSAIDEAIAELQKEMPDNNVRVFAYMDDITLVGSAEGCVLMTRILTEKLANSRCQPREDGDELRGGQKGVPQLRPQVLR